MLLQDGKIIARGEIGATITSQSISETFRFPLKVSYDDGRFRATAA
jgi:iron complex transport system ATP-binding protein